MRGTLLAMAAVISATLAFDPAASAQSASGPTIHSVTINEGAGVLTIAGVGFGRDPAVTVDGQPVVVLQGGSETRLDVLAPAALLTTPGSYRLTVVDTARHVGDVFVVATPSALASGIEKATALDAASGAAPEAAGSVKVGGALPSSASPSSDVPSPQMVIEDPGAQYRTAVGFQALFSNTTGVSNIAVGYRALFANTTGIQNTASGHATLIRNTTGNNNTASGYRALQANTTGHVNTGNGYRALYSNTIGFNNTASGGDALYSNTTGAYNTASGVGALFANTTGSNNTASGFWALNTNTTGDFNTASGVETLYANTTGAYNTANGHGTLRSNSTGTFNTASGYTALLSNTTGSANTASGTSALFFNTTGSNNVAVGTGAGYNATTGSNNIYLGANVVGVTDESNAIYLGRQGTQTKTVVAGIRGTTLSGGEAVSIDANGQLGSGPLAANAVGSSQVIDDSLTAGDLAANAVGTSELANDAVTAAKVAFNYAASTSEGGPAADLNCVGCVAASEVSFLYSFIGGLFLGGGNLTMTGTHNTSFGAGGLVGNITGFSNTAIGTSALFSNNTGYANTAIGSGGPSDVAIDGRIYDDTPAPLIHNTSGKGNTAIGFAALYNNTTGNNNVAVGYGAGTLPGSLNESATTGSNNIYLGAGAGSGGLAANDESNSIYLGRQGSQTKTVIAGIRGVTTSLADAVPVVIDSTGRLGTVSSSRRFKEDIQPMADASAGILRLRPVTFRYAQAFAGGAKPRQYGLIAEEVAELYPDLVVHAADGQVETVQYDKINAMLLNEVQKQAAQIRALTDQLAALAARVQGMEAPPFSTRPR